MAKPIEPTPILEGKDAEKLLNDLENAEYCEKKEEFPKECKKVFNSTIRNK